MLLILNTKKSKYNFKKIFLRSKCIDLDLLCIEFGVSCYEVFFEVSILYSDGYPLNLIVEGLNYAIDNFDRCKVCCNYRPVAFYFVYVKKWILGPLLEEENLKNAECVVVMGNGNLILCEKLGKECSMQEIYEILAICRQ